MAKYSYEFKKQVVNDYLNGLGGYRYLHRKYSIPGTNQVYKWVKNYNKLGDEGLRRSRANKFYSFEYKLHVVQLYLTSEVSYTELALQENIKNPTLITKWVNDFRIAGPSALRPRKKGRKTTMVKQSINSINKKTPVDITSIEEKKLQELEDENLKLRIENAYLKELRRLRLQDEQLLKEQQESYIASEDHSN